MKQEGLDAGPLAKMTVQSPPSPQNDDVQPIEVAALAGDAFDGGYDDNHSGPSQSRAVDVSSMPNVAKGQSEMGPIVEELPGAHFSEDFNLTHSPPVARNRQDLAENPFPNGPIHEEAAILGRDQTIVGSRPLFDDRRQAGFQFNEPFQPNSHRGETRPTSPAVDLVPRITPVNPTEVWPKQLTSEKEQAAFERSVPESHLDLTQVDTSPPYPITNRSQYIPFEDLRMALIERRTERQRARVTDQRSDGLSRSKSQEFEKANFSTRDGVFR